MMMIIRFIAKKSIAKKKSKAICICNKTCNDLTNLWTVFNYNGNKDDYYYDNYGNKMTTITT